MSKNIFYIFREICHTVKPKLAQGTANNLLLVPNWKKRSTLGLGEQCTLLRLIDLSSIGTYFNKNNGQGGHGFACF